MRTSSARLHLIAAVAGVGLGMTAPLTALYAKALGASDLQAGLAVSSNAVTLLAVDLLGTRAVPRIDGRLALWGALALFGAGSLVSGLFPSYAVMVGARMFQGMGAALFMGAGLRVAVDRSGPGGAGRAIGAFNAAWFLGVALGPFLSGALTSVGDHLTGLRLAFVVCAVMCGAGAVVCRLGLPPLPSGRRPEVGLPALGHLGGRRGAGALGLSAFGQAVRAGLALTLVPLVGAQRGLATTGITAALGALAVTDVTTMRVGGALGDRRNRGAVLAIALAWGALWCGVLARADGYPGFLVACLALGITVGCAWALPPAMVLDLAADGESGIMAYRIAADVGMLGGALSLGFILGTTGGSTTLLIAAGALALAAAVALWLGETRPAAADAPVPAAGSTPAVTSPPTPPTTTAAPNGTPTGPPVTGPARPVPTAVPVAATGHPPIAAPAPALVRAPRPSAGPAVIPPPNPTVEVPPCPRPPT
jgi:MFS family permease